MSSYPMGDPRLTEGNLEAFGQFLQNKALSSDDVSSIKHAMLEQLTEDEAEKDSFACSAIDRMSGACFAELLQSGMNTIGELSGKDHVQIGVKEVWSEEFFPYFATSGVRCVHVVRDPRGIIASRNYGRYVQQSCGGQKYPILFIARAWRRCVKIISELQRNPNYMLVRYEDFLQNPKQILTSICAFLEVSFDNSMCDYARYRKPDGSSWCGNVDSDELVEIQVDRAFRWKGVLSEDEVFLCELLCSEEMVELGYEKVNEDLDKDRFLRQCEDANAAASWLGAFGHTLTDTQKEVELNRMVLAQ